MHLSSSVKHKNKKIGTLNLTMVAPVPAYYKNVKLPILLNALLKIKQNIENS